jgi:hypothetical protein
LPPATPTAPLSSTDSLQPAAATRPAHAAVTDPALHTALPSAGAYLLSDGSGTGSAGSGDTQKYERSSIAAVSPHGELNPPHQPVPGVSGGTRVCERRLGVWKQSCMMPEADATRRYVTATGPAGAQFRVDPSADLQHPHETSEQASDTACCERWGAQAPKQSAPRRGCDAAQCQQPRQQHSRSGLAAPEMWKCHRRTFRQIPADPNRFFNRSHVTSSRPAHGFTSEVTASSASKQSCARCLKQTL